MGWFMSFLDKYLTYKKPRVVQVHHKLLWLVNVLLLAAVFFGIFGYFVIYRHGWQKEDRVRSAVTTKLFGVGETNTSDHTIWDNADFMIPPKENGAFTVITSVTVTRKQIQGVCKEDPSVPAGRCKVDSDCQENKTVLYGNGIMTGKCNSTSEANVSVCEIRAWCPVGTDNLSNRSYLATDDFRVYIRNNVRFPEFGKVRQNIPDDMESEELATCLFDPTHPRNKYCPIFEVSTIVEQTGNTYRSLVTDGAVIEIVIDWDCNFDSSSECLPEYSFYRMDREEHSLSRGFHLRYANKYAEDGKVKRTLYKAYGIRFIVSVQGKGRKGDWLEIKNAVGSGLGFFSLPPLIMGVLIWACGCCKQKWTDELDELKEVHVHTKQKDKKNPGGQSEEQEMREEEQDENTLTQATAD